MTTDGHDGNLAPVTDSDGALAELSAREMEILRIISQGLSNEDVANRMFLSINTVKSDIRSAYRKIGVTSRSQAVRWGLIAASRMEQDETPEAFRLVDPASCPQTGATSTRSLGGPRRDPCEPALRNPTALTQSTVMGIGRRPRA
jgi:DNA-binding CsgD family transcriptional regulator